MRIVLLAYLAMIVAGCANSKEAPPIPPDMAKQLYAGEVSFIEHCSSCHHAAATAPDLTEANPLIAGDKATLISHLLQSDSAHSMSEFSDQQLADILTFLRKDAVLAADVAEARKKVRR